MIIGVENNLHPKLNRGFCMNKKIIFKRIFRDDDYVSSDVHMLMERALLDNREEIIDAIAHDSDIEPKRLETQYEGGINLWFCLSSVMLYELGYTINAQFSSDGIELTIMR